MQNDIYAALEREISQLGRGLYDGMPMDRFEQQQRDASERALKAHFSSNGYRGIPEEYKSSFANLIQWVLQGADCFSINFNDSKEHTVRVKRIASDFEARVAAELGKHKGYIETRTEIVRQALDGKGK